MKLEDCKKCEYHYRAKFDDVLCRYSGGFDYMVIAKDKKGLPIVVMCPMERIPLPGKNSAMFENFKSILNIS